MGERLTILTPWYPSPTKPFGGSFVRAQALAVADHVAEVQVIHLDEWPLPIGGRAQRVLRDRFERLLGQSTARPETISRKEGQVLRVPVPVIPRSPYALSAESAIDSLRAALPGGVIDADVVHAHVGLPAGLAAVRCARPDARVFITEHATFLDRMLAREDGVQAYGEALERCTAFVAVSELLRDQIVAAFPQFSDKVHVVPNAIPFESIPARPTPVTDLRRWLYVGSFQERKGVRHLLEAFAICHDDRPDLTLTFVGGGPQADLLRERADALGVSRAVTVGDAVPPDEVFGLYHQHDLLVHPSRYETFGMTMIEAIAAGMPVLVTRCGGPEETLRDIEPLAGKLVGVGDGCTELVRGYRELSGRVASLDLDRARTVLASRYGYEAVGAQLRQLYSTGTPGGRE